ncbi:MAG: cobyrinate a,c-diamide synthase [Desulfobacterales bacterium]|nr:cobyrinate a,c-diamide synthase [Desulfobacterales bacterium]
MPTGIIIAAPSSGSGKTTLALGLMAVFARRGLNVAPFKIGPDFIDPGHHRHVTGRDSHNLDGWMLSRDANATNFHRHLRAGDTAVVEGVMGLFDGYDGRTEAGSTAQMAKWLALPVLMIVDARSMARSAAALVQGFENFDPDVRFLGVIFNRIGSPRHLSYLTDALDGHVAMPCLGGIPREGRIQMPERHLGLVTADDHPLSADHLDRLVDLIETHVNVDQLIRALPDIDSNVDRSSAEIPAQTNGPRIGVARDRSFCFYYPENLEMLAANGAQLVFFSPEADRCPPDGLDGLYFGGGYPETAAAALAANQRMRQAVRTMSADGMPIYAECGGFMYLCRQLVDTSGRAHAMAGCFPYTTRMLPRRNALGYREIELRADTVIGASGMRARGHEFHYSEIDTAVIDTGIELVYKIASRKGAAMAAEGYLRHQTLGSYVHLHFSSNPEMPRTFVRRCQAYQRKKDS